MQPWQATALVSLRTRELACGVSISNSPGLEVAFSAYDVIGELVPKPSQQEPRSGFPRLQGRGRLSSPRPRKGLLGCLRVYHQPLGFLDSSLNPSSQRDQLLISWVSNSGASPFLQLGRFT